MTMWLSFMFRRIMSFLFSARIQEQISSAKYYAFWHRIHGNLYSRGMRLVQDGAVFQSARTTMTLLQANRMNVLVWPSRSPDLNPIEHIWDVIGREVRRKSPKNGRQLKQFNLDEWNRTAQRTCLRYMASMRNHCQAVIRADDGLTRYWSMN